MEVTHFSGHIVDVEAEFVDADGVIHLLTISVDKDVSVVFKNNSKSKTVLDDNAIAAYPGYSTVPIAGIPWKYLSAGVNEKMLGDVSPNKKHDAINLSSSSPDLMITPMTFPSAKTQIELNFTGSSVPLETDLSGCSNNPELKLFIGSKKTVPIQFYRLCETDDDVQLVLSGTTVSSPMDVCISSGPDGFLDISGRYKGGNDVVDVMAQVIRAGPGSICETTVLPTVGHPAPCASNINATRIVSDMNRIYESAGIEFVATASSFSSSGVVATLDVNYDLSVDDGILSIQEQQRLHEITYGSLMTGPPTALCWVVPDIADSGYTTITAGRATASMLTGPLHPHGGINTFAIDQAIGSNGYTVAHETGHAQYDFYHPEDHPGVGDSKNYMSKDVNGSRDIIRYYQFKTMH